MSVKPVYCEKVPNAASMGDKCDVKSLLLFHGPWLIFCHIFDMYNYSRVCFVLSAHWAGQLAIVLLLTPLLVLEHFYVPLRELQWLPARRATDNAIAIGGKITEASYFVCLILCWTSAFIALPAWIPAVIVPLILCALIPHGMITNKPLGGFVKVKGGLVKLPDQSMPPEPHTNADKLWADAYARFTTTLYKYAHIFQHTVATAGIFTLTELFLGEIAHGAEPQPCHLFGATKDRGYCL